MKSCMKSQWSERSLGYLASVSSRTSVSDKSINIPKSITARVYLFLLHVDSIHHSCTKSRLEDTPASDFFFEHHCASSNLEVQQTRSASRTICYSVSNFFCNLVQIVHDQLWKTRAGPEQQTWTTLLSVFLFTLYWETWSPFGVESKRGSIDFRISIDVEGPVSDWHDNDVYA